MFLVTRQIFFYWWLKQIKFQFSSKLLPLDYSFTILWTFFAMHILSWFSCMCLYIELIFCMCLYIELIFCMSVYRYLTGQVLYLWSEVLPPMFLSVKSSIYVPHNNGIFARCLRVIIKNIFKKCTNCHSFASNSNLGTPLLSYICFTQIETVF